MSPRTYLVTGGAGFLGSALVRRLVAAGHRVRILDDLSRGSADRLHDLAGAYELIEADIRDTEAVVDAAKGVDSLCHFAFVNGTELFYAHPDRVLDVGVKGIVNVLEACNVHAIPELVVASSSEVYHVPSQIPTPEAVALTIPDPLNPRYSYAAGKMLTEMMALHANQQQLSRVLVVRPHNVYGPAMGWEHVVPQFALRMRLLARAPGEPIRFPIQGTGQETRAFTHIDDFIDGLWLVMERGEHRAIYHIGTMEELTIEAVAKMVGRCFGKEVVVVPGQPAAGSPGRRCPDTAKIQQLGFRPRVRFMEGLPKVVKWYDDHADEQPTTQSARWVPVNR